MTAVPVRVLVVEDDAAMAALLRDGLRRQGHQVEETSSVRQALQVLESSDPFDVVITDVRLGMQDGLELVEFLRARAKAENNTPPSVIVITAFGSLETAVRSFRAGATDFLTKPFELHQLALAIERALEARRLKGEIRRLRRENGYPFPGGIIAESASMKGVLDTVERAAESDATVLITGPSGTGKELVAKALHERSRRAEGPFIAINCAALPEHLLESELFGYRRGAFTDARTNKEGLLQAAAGGTLFLDELGEMPLSLQPKILRVLQEREVTPLGSTRGEPVDVRVIGATNQNLEQAVSERRFREDLYYRVNVIRIELTPLVKRKEDILPLADAFMARLVRRHGRALQLTPEARKALHEYGWPGNVRELENALERAATLTRTGTLDVSDLPLGQARPYGAELDWAVQRKLTLDQLSTDYCLAVLKSYDGNQSSTARHLDIDRKTLAKRLAGVGGAGEGESD